MEKVSKILLCVFCYAIIFYSINIICPADEIINILNEAVGLKKFIHDTSKEKIKLLLIDDPQLYYNLLPYAYVFGMSKIWKSKFDELKIDPPLRMIIHKNNLIQLKQEMKAILISIIILICGIIISKIQENQ